MKKIIIIAAALIYGAAANAQADYGVVNYFSLFGISRAHQLSTFDLNLSTARSAAMGGAFTSLGADLSSIHINPAGLGMYQSSDFGVTLGPSTGNLTNSMRGENSVSDSRTSLAINNFGAVFNIFESSGQTTSFSIGAGYSRMADYNYRNRMGISNSRPENGIDVSILEVFDKQADNGLLYNDNGWGAYLANEVGLIESEGPGKYYIPSLHPNASVRKNMSEFSRGSAGEYSFGAGWNFQNKFYVGLSIGIVDIYQDREMTYSEDYGNNDNAEKPTQYMDYTQRVKTVGSGYNMKLGMIYRPIPELRVGFAFHSPTVVSLRDYADYEIAAGYGTSNNFDREVQNADYYEYHNNFYTPARILAGISYTFLNTGILAIDYERAFYNGISLYGGDYPQSDKDFFRDEVRNFFKGSDALRAGLEIMATDELAIRLGYGITRDGIKKKIIDDELGVDLPVRRESSVFSAGFGIKIGPYTSFDATYSLLSAKMTDYDMFYYHSESLELYPGNNQFHRTKQKLQRHNIMLSLNYRF